MNISTAILIQSAVERKLEILGEAAGRVTEETRQKRPQVDWKGTVGLRNIIIHRYSQVDADNIWRIITTILPPMKNILISLLPRIED